MENLTKSLLSNVKATKLKEIAKLTGVPKYTKMKKEELFNTMFAEFKVASTVTFVSEGNSTFGYPCVLNKETSVVKDEYSIEVSEPLNKWHKDFLTEVVQEDNNTDVVMYKVKGNILRINSLREYLFLMECFGSININGIRELDLNSVRKEYDGVQFTNNCISECNVNEEYSLSHYKYGFVTILNDCDNVSYGKNVIASEELLLEIKSELDDSLSNLRKREQFQIRNINILDLQIRKSNKGSVVVLPKDAGVTVPTSENRIFRDYNEPEIEKEVFNITNADIKSLKNKFDNIIINKKEGTITVNKTVNKVPSFIILNGVANIPATVNKEERKKLQAKRELLLDMIMLKGFYNEENGKLYRVVAQSASQQRLGKYIFTSQNWEEVRTKMLYGYDFGKEFVRTTKEARCGLAFTSALLVKDFHPTIKIMEDPWETVHSNVIIPTGVDKENHKVEIYDEENEKILIEKAEKDIIFQPNDGAAQMQIIPFARACYGIGIISRKEFKYLKDNYKDIFQMTEINNKNKNERTKEESKLLKIFNKLPAVLQIRYGGCKGLVIKFPVKDYRPDLTEDIIAGNNFVKFMLEDYSNVNFEVCGVPKKEKNYALMNYQFLQFLNISAEDLCSMAEEQLDKISNNILKDAKEALKFLGMIEGISSDETTGIVSKFTKILATNPDMLQDVYVQKNIKDLMAKFVYNIAFGRMPVKGQYQFVISDPFHFLAEGSKDVNGLLKYTMNKNQNYSNGNKKKVALFRPPMTSGDEIQEIELTENKQLWFLKDVLVLNCYSLTLPGAGGASL